MDGISEFVGDVVGKSLVLKLGRSDGISDGRVLGIKDFMLGLDDGFELKLEDGNKEGSSVG